MMDNHFLFIVTVSETTVPNQKGAGVIVGRSTLHKKLNLLSIQEVTVM